MAWNNTFGWFHSGESQDATCEQLPANMVLQTTRTQTGSRGFQHTLSTNNAQARLDGLYGVNDGSTLIACSGAIGLSAAPSSEMMLIHHSTNNHKVVSIGTDRKLYFYANNGAQVGTASTNTIPTTGLQEVTIFFDGITLSTVWISVFFGTTQDISFDTGYSWADFFHGSIGQLYWGENLSGGVNRGADLFTDDLYIAKSSTAGDAPHLTAYPRPRGNGLANIATSSEGTYHAWVGNTASPNTWQDIDETPHNSDTDYRDTSTKNIRHTFKSSTANILPDPCTIIKVQMRSVGRLLGGGKYGAHFYLIRGGSGLVGGLNAATSQSETYGGGLDRTSFIDGWVRADFNANATEFGWESENHPVLETGPRITQQLGPEIVYYTASLGLSTKPTKPVSKSIYKNQAVNRANTY